MRVLITRPKHDAERTAERVRHHGHEAIIAPVMTLMATPPAHLLEDDMAEALVITSANALDAIAGHDDEARLKTIPLFAVGERTASIARRHGYRTVSHADGDAESLVALVLGSMARGSHVLHLSGRDLARDISTDLRKHGFKARHIKVYHAEPAEDFPERLDLLLRSGALDAVLHFSPRSAGLFSSAVQSRGIQTEAYALLHVCLSPNIAVMLEPLHARSVTIATRPHEDALLEALDRTSRQDGSMPL